MSISGSQRRSGGEEGGKVPVGDRTHTVSGKETSESMKLTGTYISGCHLVVENGDRRVTLRDLSKLFYGTGSGRYL